MKFTLLITQPPASPVAAKALDFAGALLREGHAISRVFFFSEGVKNARSDCAYSKQWQALVTKNQIDTTVCSGSAASYDVTDSNSLLPIAGMGDWLMATLDSDKLVTF